MAIFDNPDGYYWEFKIEEKPYEGIGATIRYVDGDNYWFCRLYNNVFHIFEVVSGAFNQRYNAGAGLSSTAEPVIVTDANDTPTIINNGYVAAAAKSTAGAENTKAGLHLNPNGNATGIEWFCARTGTA